MMEVVSGDISSHKTCNAPVILSPPSANMPAARSFLQAGCLSCHPTNSVKALKGNPQSLFRLKLIKINFKLYILEGFPLINFH